MKVQNLSLYKNDRDFNGKRHGERKLAVTVYFTSQIKSMTRKHKTVHIYSASTGR